MANTKRNAWLCDANGLHVEAIIVCFQRHASLHNARYRKLISKCFATQSNRRYPQRAATVLAFVSGTIGTLLGGNLAQLHRIKGLDVADVSIGGAGTFGAIFICCILPALIA